MSIDLGDVRTGIAVCDEMEILASPVEVIIQRDRQALFEKIAQKAHELKVEMIVVGHPVNMDGSRGFKAQECEQGADSIRKLTGLPVILWDERCTTKSAISALNVTNTRGKKRKAVIDAVAAVMILEDFLRSRK